MRKYKFQDVKNVFKKYIKYNMVGIVIFVVSTLVFGAVLSISGSWWAWIVAGGIGGLVEFSLQLNFVYKPLKDEKSHCKFCSSPEVYCKRCGKNQ